MLIVYQFIIAAIPSVKQERNYILYSDNKAVKVAIRKYKHMLENYLDEVIDNENDDEDEDDEDEDEDEDEEEEEEVD